MNQHLQYILTLAKNSAFSPNDDQMAISQAIKEVDKVLTITEFKLSRLEKEKRTISILLEETIEELQAKSLILEKANANLIKALKEIKATQEQLIQREKMASLGELITGIAHEIQNPLNFVNNFSELSIELIDELNEDYDKPQSDSELEIELINDIKANLNKILFHGQRASSIVKGMLGHSRTSKGEFQLTNLNVLCEEYLRLAYHGMQAKDKQVNVILETNFDSTLQPILVIPQEISRVLLNLYTNAFYAVQQRVIRCLPDESFTPIVSISTKRVDKQAMIQVRDNGVGIPELVKAKIFQPFFTTKPTGEGTGLGLSLSYDIITKGHGGKLNVESNLNQGAVFTIFLPLT